MIFGDSASMKVPDSMLIDANSPMAKQVALAFLQGFHLTAWALISPYVVGLMNDPGADIIALGNAMLHTTLLYSIFDLGLKFGLIQAYGSYRSLSATPSIPFVGNPNPK
jgi:hypothetical protein